MRVVVGDVFVQYPLEVSARDDQNPVETLAPDAADPAFGVRPSRGALRIGARSRSRIRKRGRCSCSARS
jgi:hypothetical protein